MKSDRPISSSVSAEIAEPKRGVFNRTKGQPPYGMSRIAWRLWLCRQGLNYLADGAVMLLTLGGVTSSFSLNGAFKMSKRAVRAAKEKAAAQALAGAGGQD